MKVLSLSGWMSCNGRKRESGGLFGPFLSGTAGCLLAGILVLAGCAGVPDRAPSGPREAAETFTRQLERLDVSGLPEGQARRVLEPLLAPELAGYFRDARRIQKTFQRKNPDEKPPWIEGDLFGSLFEGAQTYQVGAVSERGDRAEVVVWQTHTDRGDTVRWKDIYLFRKSARGWVLEDIRYRGNWPFASSGTLVEVLTAEGC